MNYFNLITIQPGKRLGTLILENEFTLATRDLMGRSSVAGCSNISAVLQGGLTGLSIPSRHKLLIHFELAVESPEID